MRFLLVAVNSKYIHSNPAIYSLCAYAEAAGIPETGEIRLAEYTINESVEQILQQIYLEKPEVIGFSCYIWNISYIKHLVRDLAVVLPKVPVWLGGPEASYAARELLEELPSVKGIMVGEGEHSFTELVRYYGGEGSLADIPGLVYREGAEIRDTGPCRAVPLSELPFLYRELETFDHRIVYYESSRGCPYRCSYCLSSIDKTVRFRDMESVKQELQFFLDRKVPQVKFIDRTFNVRADRSLEIWRYLADHDNGVTNFHFEISADLLTEAEFAVMEQMRPGLIQLEIGVQTTNPQTMEAIRRHASFEKIAANVNRIHEMKNIHQHLDLIAGLPYEDYESFGRSFDDVYRMQPNQLQLGFLKVLKGSAMYDMAGNYGIEYSARQPYEVLQTRWLPYERILQLKQIEEVVETYYNSGQFRTAIGYLAACYERPFVLYEELAVFCSRNQYNRMAHSRQRQYEQLLAFVDALLEESSSGMKSDRWRMKQTIDSSKVYTSDNEQCIEQNIGSQTVYEPDGRCTSVRQLNRDIFAAALVHDCYLRENCKSRPSFAAAGGVPDRDFLRTFYQAEAVAPRYLRDYEGCTSKQLANLTHMERYPVDVLALAEGTVEWRETVILYDYRNRSPLTNDGSAFRI